MVFDYLITFRKRSETTVDAVSQLMYVFALLAFSYYAYTDYARVIYLAFNFLILVSWIFCLIKKQKTGTAMFRLGLFIATIGWLMAPGGRTLFAILYAVAGLLEKQVKFPEEIGFSKKSVVINSFPKKTFDWSEIQNVVLKDNILTVDFKNNKIIQKELNEDVSALTEQEFNEFCKAQITTTVS